MITAAILTGGPVGGPAPYHADAVHFDGATLIALVDQGAALAADSPTGILTLWVKGADIFNSSPNPAFVFGTANDTFDIKNALGVQNGLGTDFADSPDFNDFYATNNNSNPIPSNVWTLILMAWNMAFASGSRVFQMYYGDSVQTPAIENDDGGAFSCNYADTGWAFFGPYGNDACILADVSDMQMWCGTTVDLSITANRRLFINGSGKPVNPRTAATSLGHQTMLFSGNATAFGTNQGAGAATNVSVGTLTNASTSPSD